MAFRHILQIPQKFLNDVLSNHFKLQPQEKLTININIQIINDEKEHTGYINQYLIVLFHMQFLHIILFMNSSAEKLHIKGAVNQKTK